MFKTWGKIIFKFDFFFLPEDNARLKCRRKFVQVYLVKKKKNSIILCYDKFSPILNSNPF